MKAINKIRRVLGCKKINKDFHLKSCSSTFQIYLVLNIFLTSTLFAQITVEGKQDLNYSNTQIHFDVSYQPFLKETVKYLPQNWKQLIRLPDHPSNTSVVTKKELQQLLVLQKKRNNDKKLSNLIRQERTIAHYGKIGPVKLTEIFSSADNPLKRLFLAARKEVGIVVFHFKKKFDRVRPAYLEPKLKPNIITPLHPAYPSGHSTVAFVYAHLLSELDNNNSKNYFKDAGRIAKNREFAGVHYPSDSQAGELLAQQIYNLMLKNPQFNSLLVDAKKFWKNHKVGDTYMLLPLQNVIKNE